MEYIAMHYKGKEWGLWGKSCKCFIVFGTKKRMQELADKMNRGEEK